MRGLGLRFQSAGHGVQDLDEGSECMRVQSLGYRVQQQKGIGSRV